MLELIIPTTRLHTAWLEARDEWGRGVHQDGSGLRETDDVDSPAGFAAWVAGLTAAEDPAHDVGDRVHCSYRWIVEDGRLVGAVALRHELNDQLLTSGGHIGYGVRPSARGHGVASWALARMLDEAHRRDLGRVLITCDVDNVASARVIERCGGVLEDVRTVDGRSVKRYWVTL